MVSKSNRSKLDVEGTEDFMNGYREEVAQEFGVFQSTLQTDQQSSMTNVTKKVVKQKRKGKRGNS